MICLLAIDACVWYGLWCADFFCSVYHRNRRYRWKRTIEPLTEDDRDNHLFYTVHTDCGKSLDTFEDSGIVSDMAQRSYTQPEFGTRSDATLTSTAPDLQPHLQGKNMLDSITCWCDDGSLGCHVDELLGGGVCQCDTISLQAVCVCVVVWF